MIDCLIGYGNSQSTILSKQLAYKYWPFGLTFFMRTNLCNLAVNDNNKFDFNVEMVKLTIKQLEMLLDQYISFYDQTVDIENRIAKMIH